MHINITHEKVTPKKAASEHSLGTLATILLQFIYFFHHTRKCSRGIVVNTGTG